jgi:signal transduction histidine kinase
MILNTLSGRFLVLTIIFVMLAEILIFLPSIARFRFDYLSERLERSQIASLSLLATKNQTVNPELEAELLQNAGVISIALRRDDFRELVLALPMPGIVEKSFDLRDPGAFSLIGDALELFTSEDRIIRVIGVPVQSGGQEIEATLYEAPLKIAMIEYGRNIFIISLFISVITAALLFFAVRKFIVQPISRVAKNMHQFQESPEDNRLIIEPNASVYELRVAEDALRDMQMSLSSSLKQKERLAQLGGAVAKVSHDLRNMLTTATLVADRFEMSDDPIVKRTAPKLISSLDRAINLCERTLTFGKAEEPDPTIKPVKLRHIAEDVLHSESLRAGDHSVETIAQIEDDFMVHADQEQLFRVLMNLTRNARQAIENSGNPGTVEISARDTGTSAVIEVRDDGPGLPEKAQKFLFQPFQGGTRREGSGLGLAIAAELIRGHGGALTLVETGENGTVFQIELPHAPA